MFGIPFGHFVAYCVNGGGGWHGGGNRDGGIGSEEAESDLGIMFVLGGLVVEFGEKNAKV